MDINPVICVNVTLRLASESAQSLFGNPSLAYYGAIAWVPFVFGMLDVSPLPTRCKQHYTALGVGIALDSAWNYGTGTYYGVALLQCACAITFPNRGWKCWRC